MKLALPDIVLGADGHLYANSTAVPPRATHGRSSRGGLVKSSLPTLWGPGLCPPLRGSPQRGPCPPLRGSPPDPPGQSPSLGLRFSTEQEIVRGVVWLSGSRPRSGSPTGRVTAGSQAAA